MIKPAEYISIPDIPKDLLIKRSKRAKRLSLKLDSGTGEIFVTLPIRTSLKRAEEFAREYKDWILERIASAAKPIPFVDGAEIPVMSDTFTIQHIPEKLRGLVTKDDNRLLVPGMTEHVSRRVHDFLKETARDEITKRGRDKAARIGKIVKRFRIADQKTRWGSCTSDGTLSFSWRLVLAPEYVLDYVVAHEVAHMEHMNHSKAFWALCNQLTDQPYKGKNWLKINGSELMRYGRNL